MQEGNQKGITINLRTIAEFINQWFFKIGILLIILATKSLVLYWILNSLLLPHSIALSLSEIFLGLLAVTIIGTCVTNKNNDVNALNLMEMKDTLEMFGNNQLIQNQQIITALSLMLDHAGLLDDAKKPKILNENDSSS